MLARDSQRASAEIQNHADNSPSNQNRPKQEPHCSPFKDRLQIILVSVTQDSVELDPVLPLKERKNNRECARPESEPTGGRQRKPANAIDTKPSVEKRSVLRNEQGVHRLIPARQRAFDSDA